MHYTRESFEREQPLARRECFLPAATYNLTRILLAASPKRSVFVPIRAMQYLAVIDPEEIIFVDSQYRRWVEVAWRRFHANERAALDQPVSYEAVFYAKGAEDTQRRIQGEFHKALGQLQDRNRPHAPGKVLALKARG